MSDCETRDEHALSRASEDYLETIYRIAMEVGSEEASVRSVDVAEHLGVSKASVNKALSTLKEAGMVEQSRYGRVTLTDEGRRYAALVWRAHRALRTFLEKDLGVEAGLVPRHGAQPPLHLVGGLLGNDDELRKTFEGVDRLRFLTAVPAGDHEFALVVAVDEADEVAEHKALLVAESGARKNEGGVGGIGHVNGDPGVNERRFARGEREGFVEQGAQIEPRRTGRRVARQVFADAFVKNAVGELHGIKLAKRNWGEIASKGRSQRSSSGPYSSSRRSTA